MIDGSLYKFHRMEIAPTGAIVQYSHFLNGARVAFVGDDVFYQTGLISFYWEYLSSAEKVLAVHSQYNRRAPRDFHWTTKNVSIFGRGGRFVGMLSLCGRPVQEVPTIMHVVAMVKEARAYAFATDCDMSELVGYLMSGETGIIVVGEDELGYSSLPNAVFPVRKMASRRLLTDNNDTGGF